MTFATIYLAWSLTSVCPLLQSYRAQGLTDAAIEALAKEHGVPRWVIVWAKRHC